MNKQALITGATSGIGYALAERATAQGYAVIGLGRDFSRRPSSCHQTFVLDQADLHAVESFCAQQRAHLQALDLLVLNAGYGQFGSIEQFSSSQIQRLITTNLTSNLVLLSKLIPHMKARGRGDVVIIGSESSQQGAKQGSVYCASKFGLRGLAQSLRAECASSGIRVILVNPGPVRTHFFTDLAFAPAAGDEFALNADDVADSVFAALALPATTVVDELNLQPLKRVFEKT